MTADPISGSAGLSKSTPERPGGRKLAEWVTLSLSIVLVTALAAFLVYEAVREDPSFVPVEVRVKTEGAEPRDGRYIVPVHVRNRGRQTLKGFTLNVRIRPPGGEWQSSDLVVDYLGEGATQVLYLYVDQEPGQLEIEARPVGYALE